MLFECIDDVRINGRPSELSSAISAMDICLQDLADQTNQMDEMMTLMSGNLKGQQFEKAVTEIHNFSVFLCEMSDKLNEMQREVVDYQNRISRFEGLAEDGTYNNLNVRVVNVFADTGEVQLTSDQWILVYEKICEYCRNSMDSASQLQSKKNDVGEIWQDSQYMRFSDFIDSIVNEAKEKILVVEDYAQNLKTELSRLGIVI